MSEDKKTLAILFADVCESTPLYQRVGDDEGLRLVGEFIDALASIVRSNEGQVIRSKGDDLLCTFPRPDDALEAASQMLDQAGAGEVKIHIGIHYGLTIHARGDIYGDAVNLAARLLALANPGELLMSEAVHARLSDANATRPRLIGQQSLKGIQEPVRLFSMSSSRAGTDPVETVRPPAGKRPKTQSPSVRLTLRFRDQQHVFREGGKVSIGRSSSCDCVIPNEWVSRKHASISINRGIATLTDSSSSGTYVTIRSDPPLLLRRSSIALISSGAIYLGSSPDEPDAPVVHYQLETSRPGKSGG
jgi:class 3 adenylate cyclase